MQIEKLPDNILKEITADGSEIEFCFYTPRNKTGARSWEIKLQNGDGTRKVIAVRDYGINITKEVVEVHPFKNREGRNEEILRLYKDEGLSQLFLANLFNISQPSVSLIVNGK